jgi:hypothetical protein
MRAFKYNALITLRLLQAVINCRVSPLNFVGPFEKPSEQSIAIEQFEEGTVFLYIVEEDVHPLIVQRDQNYDRNLSTDLSLNSRFNQLNPIIRKRAAAIKADLVDTTFLNVENEMMNVLAAITSKNTTDMLNELSMKTRSAEEVQALTQKVMKLL